MIEIDKPGYQTARVLIEPRIDSRGSVGFAGNVLLGGLIGAAIDGVTGAMYSHGSVPLVVVLRPVPQPGVAALPE